MNATADDPDATTGPANHARLPTGSDEPEPTEHSWDEDDLADEMSKESFPTSDPPSTWTGDRRG